MRSFLPNGFCLKTCLEMDLQSCSSEFGFQYFCVKVQVSYTTSSKKYRKMNRTTACESHFVRICIYLYKLRCMFSQRVNACLCNLGGRPNFDRGSSSPGFVLAFLKLFFSTFLEPVSPIIEVLLLRCNTEDSATHSDAQT